MRACALLHAIDGSNLDRVAGAIVEVYPGAALREWGYDTKGYKQHRSHREQLLESLSSGGWIELGNWGDGLVQTDHALDAFLSALVARAASVKKVVELPAEHAADAAVEGWIHLPSVTPSELLD